MCVPKTLVQTFPSRFSKVTRIDWDPSTNWPQCSLQDHHTLPRLIHVCTPVKSTHTLPSCKNWRIWVQIAVLIQCAQVYSVCTSLFDVHKFIRCAPVYSINLSPEARWWGRGQDPSTCLSRSRHKYTSHLSRHGLAQMRSPPCRTDICTLSTHTTWAPLPNCLDSPCNCGKITDKCSCVCLGRNKKLCNWVTDIPPVTQILAALWDAMELYVIPFVVTLCLVTPVHTVHPCTGYTGLKHFRCDNRFMMCAFWCDTDELRGWAGWDWLLVGGHGHKHGPR